MIGDKTSRWKLSEQFCMIVLAAARWESRDGILHINFAYEISTTRLPITSIARRDAEAWFVLAAIKPIHALRRARGRTHGDVAVLKSVL